VHQGIALSSIVPVFSVMTLEQPANGFRARLDKAVARLDNDLASRNAFGVACYRELVRSYWVNGAAEALCGYLDLLVTWGKRHDLTAARSADELVDLTLPDAWIMAHWVQPDSTLADIGAGAGAPGLPLMLMRPDVQVSLVEPRTKRVAFLRTAIGQLCAPRVVPVLRQRSEQLPKWAYDSVVSRAVLAPQPWLEHGATLARQKVWVLLAQSEAPQLQGFRASVDVRYQWPLTDVARRAVQFERLPS
jgi:16S rRNA (guanine527-N7)-methyltransferase